ncbi:MAG: hypothetical protein VYE81_09400 [Planctomycetota bacterium]|nr:hypothetical protein [Planctomycetota bacterium]
MQRGVREGRVPAVEAEFDVSGQLELTVVEAALVDGVRVVEAVLANRGAGLSLDWSVVWWDRGGEPLLGASKNWRRLSLAAGGEARIHFHSPAPAGESWRLLARASE